MKGKTFTVTASGWSGSCNSAYLDFSQCSVCSLTEESQTKSITGQSSVSWTTTTTTDTATAQKVTVTVSGGCSGESADSSSFDVILPPVITINSYSPSSYSDPSGSSTINLNFRNSGETVAKDVGITLSLPSGVSTTDETSQTESTIDPNENWGTSWALSFGSISASTNIYIYIIPSNADSKTVTIPISITSGPGGTPGGDGPSGTLPPSEDGGVKKRERKFDIVPGVGLRNNTRLQAAIQKVLGNTSMNQNAYENMMRLSQAITSEIEVSKHMESSQTRSNITMQVRYSGQERVKNFILHESVPKLFAQSASDITVNAPGASYEVVVEDPEFVFLFPEVDPGQSLTITYTVNSEVDTSVLDQTDTVIYAESYEGLAPGEICSAGERRCVGDDLQECSQDGTEWATIQTCQYGCESGQCKSPLLPAIGMQTILMIGGIVVVIVIVIVAAVFVSKRKKKPSLIPEKALPSAPSLKPA